MNCLEVAFCRCVNVGLKTMSLCRESLCECPRRLPYLSHEFDLVLRNNRDVQASDSVEKVVRTHGLAHASPLEELVHARANEHMNRHMHKHTQTQKTRRFKDDSGFFFLYKLYN